MVYSDKIALELLRCCLNRNDDINCVDQSYWGELYSFFCRHAIVSLAFDRLKSIPDEYSEIKMKWKNSVYSNISVYTRLIKRQDQILSTFQSNHIPVVVLKGSSAAKYYPNPQLRAMGDIDLLVKPNDYSRAVKCLTNIGCRDITGKSEEERGRHRSFRYNDVTIELHHYFSLNVDGEKANALDDLLINSIPDNDTVLPDEENGLVFLSHIRQHLKDGLGLRQIIDWYMFAGSHVDDEMWYSSFRDKVRITGLEPLAVTVTKMCQRHLGLDVDRITWCESADDRICDDLMQFVMDCGNLARGGELLQSSFVEKLPSFRHPIQLFKYIQYHGEKNWKALNKHPWLKPFSWIYQSCRYINAAVHNRIGAQRLKEIYAEGQKRNEMFDALGV